MLLNNNYKLHLGVKYEMVREDKGVLGFALLWKDYEKLIIVEEYLKLTFDFKKIEETEKFELPYSSYYITEMGKPLFKKFVITNKVITKDNIKNIKLKTISIEDRFRFRKGRTVNIDPFLIDIDQLIIPTTKYRGNRIYLGDGIYIEMELWYHNKSYQPFLWTYLDYKEYIPFFNKVRKKYLLKL